MRSIEFLAPVESMRGNLSGNQVLEYPTQNNRAWDAPSGKVSFARNYNTRYIGAKRSASGLKYFAVKQRHAVNNSLAARTQQAVFAAAQAYYEYIIKDITVYTEALERFRTSGATSFRSFVVSYVADFLRAGRNMFGFVSGGVLLRNMWKDISLETTTAVPISKDLVVKFWKEISGGGVFYVGRQMAILPAGDSVSSVLDIIGYSFQGVEGWYNILNFSTSTVGEIDYVKIEDAWVLNPAGQYLKSEDNLQPGGVYKLTLTAPTA